MLIDNFIPRSKLTIRLVTLPLVTAVFFLAAPVANADDIFVKIDGVRGESRAEGFEETIQALNWKWGVNQSSSFIAGTGVTRGTVTVQKLSFTHEVDQASPVLMKHCTSGRS